MFKSLIKEIWHSSRSLDIISAICVTVAIFYALGFISNWIFSQRFFALKSVIVDVRSVGKSNVSPEEVKNAVLQALNGTALTTELKILFDSISSNQWIDRLVIRRIWPNKILIIIEEHQVIATWNSKKYISATGRILDFTDTGKENIQRSLGCALVSLSGPNGTQKRVLNRANELNKKLVDYGLSLSRLSLSELYTWEAETLDRTVIKLGGDKIVSSASSRMDNFLSSLEWLKKRNMHNGTSKHINLVDLRYAKGFAFKVKKEKSSRNNDDSNLDAAKKPNNCFHNVLLQEDLV